MTDEPGYHSARTAVSDALIRAARQSALRVLHGAAGVLVTSSVTTWLVADHVAALVVLTVGVPASGAVWLLARLRSLHRARYVAGLLGARGAVDPQEWDPLTSALREVVQSAEQLRGHAQDDLRRAHDAEAGALALLARRVQLEERELSTLTAELHDTVAQSLLSAIWTLEEQDDVTREALREVQRAERELRDVLAMTRLPAPGSDLASAVISLIGEFENRWGMHVTVTDWPVVLLELRVDVAATVYRFYQEALRNALKHSGQLYANLSLTSDGAGVVARVEDFGAGFCPGQVPTAGGEHLGLASLADRARACGGSFQVVSSPGAGTLAELTVPLLESDKSRP